MIFESGKYRVIAPLDPLEGGSYVEPVTYNFITKDINYLYKTMMQEEDYINPVANGMFSWRTISSCASDSDIGLENWQ
jgi:hypothetical protein